MENPPTQTPAATKSDESVSEKNQSAPKEAAQKPSLLANRKKLLIIGALIIAALIALFLWSKNYGPLSDKANLNSQPGATSTNSSTGANSSQPAPQGAIAKVGDEYIFQTDLDIELANYPAEKNDATKKLLLNKLVKDSITLQAADKDKVLALNPAVYNSPAKDYGKRVSDIKAIEKKLDAGIDQISGGIVSLWFHNYEIPKMGLEKAKQTAFDRISSLHARVVSKEITIEEAGKIIQNTPSYGDLDVGYKTNAFVSFTEPKGDHITIDEEFNKVLWSLKPGEVSPVFLGWNFNTGAGKEEEAFYAFGQLSGKVDQGNSQDFAAWYDSQKSNYEVTYF